MYRLASSDLPVVSAIGFVKRYPGSGRVVRIPQFGLSFCWLKNQLCGGSESQVVAPVDKYGSIPCTFLESCPYPANETGLTSLLRQGLALPQDAWITVEEAAPLFGAGSLNLWHWTLENLPKLLVLESVGYTGKYIVSNALDRPEGAVIRESLAMFGIGEDRILRSGPLYQVKRLVLAQRVSGFDLPQNLPLCEFLRTRLMDVTGILPGSKRLYVRRIGRRRVRNEEELLSMLAEYDFEVMTPEELPLLEQWRCMTNVRCSVMAHGANSTLTLLQKFGSGFVEMFSHRYISYNNLHSARLLKLHYYPLVEELDVSHYAQEQTPVAEFMRQGLPADMTVDPLHVRIILERILD